MKLAEAIASSSGNKARATNDQGSTIIVQERYTDLIDRWYHVWLLADHVVVETDIAPHQISKLSIYHADATENYWFPV